MTNQQTICDILLLETPFLLGEGSEEANAYVESKYNLAILALGSFIKENSDYQVTLVNMVKDKISTELLMQKIKELKPAIIGISIYSYNLSRTYSIIERIKKIFPEIHICVGGPHVIIYPKETIMLECIDSIVLGDGEIPLLEICHQLLKNGKLNDKRMPVGTYTKKSISNHMSLVPFISDDIDTLPVPDITLLGNYKRYRDFLSNKIMGIIIGSRGCPFTCHYCHAEKSKYRQHSIKHIINNMRYYKDLGVEYIEFWDDTFNPSKKRLDDFANAILEANLNMTFSIRGSVVLHVPYETMVKLKKAGMRIIQFGIETTNPRLLKMMNKRFNEDNIQKAIETCHRVGVKTVTNLMINIPTQTKEEILHDFSVMKKLRPTYINVNIYNFAPGTIFYEQAVHEGTISDFWREYATNPQEDKLTHAVNNTSIENIYQMRNQYIASYYLNLNHMIRLLRQMHPDEILPSIRIGLLILKTYVKTFMKRWGMA